VALSVKKALADVFPALEKVAGQARLVRFIAPGTPLIAAEAAMRSV